LLKSDLPVIPAKDFASAPFADRRVTTCPHVKTKMAMYARVFMIFVENLMFEFWSLDLEILLEFGIWSLNFSFGVWCFISPQTAARPPPTTCNLLR
jgi:hypothetical protein